MNSRSIKQFHLYEWYYLLVVMAYILTMATRLLRPGVFASLLLLGIALELLLRKQIVIRKECDYLVLAYIIYNLLSVIWLVKSGLPVSIYVEEFSTSILPIVFYFVGRSQKLNTDKFYQRFLFGIGLLFAVGLILYIVAPQFFMDFLFEMQYISLADVPTMRLRMTSVVGSTLVGFLAVCGMVVSMNFIMQEKKRVQGLVLFFINTVFAFLSNQRSAMLVAIFVFIYMNYIVFFTFKTLKKKYLFWELGAVAAAMIALCIFYVEAVQKIMARLISLPGAIGERSEQWVVAMNTLYSTWLGNGLGANGHKALGIEGTHIIADGGLVKLFCEEGVIGFSIFLFLLIRLCTKRIRSLKECYVEFGIIGIVLLQSVGSNIIAFQLATPIFWFAIGAAFTEHSERIDENLKENE